MISRQYNRRIEIFKTATVPDGYGGNTVTEVSLGEFWAEAKQNSSFRDNAVGKSDIKNVWSFNIRTNPVIFNDIDNLSILYNGKRYVSNDIRYNDELFREVNIIAHGIG